MNEKSINWLHQIKIPTGHINQGQLKNGYLFGLIFQKFNLIRDKKYKNNHDLPCIFQNFKNTKDLLYDNFGIMFPANQIIYRYNQLLQKIRQACKQYEQNKQQIKLAQIKKKYQTINNNAQTNTMSGNQQKLLSLRQKQIQDQTSAINKNNLTLNRTYGSNQPKLPPKILQIQKKLTKYKDQQTMHQLLSLQNRKKQLQLTNQAVQDHRYFQMSKLKMTQQMRKQLQKRVVDVVAKTQEQKLKRIQKDQQFFRFMKSKKDNFYNEIRNQQQRGFKQGLQDFQLNCLRQGVELQHDPNKKFQSKQDNFNQKVVLQRIKDNIKSLQRQRKQRQKRTNSKFVQTQQTNLKSQKIWQQNYLIQKLQKNMAKQFKYLDQTLQRKNYQKATKQQIQIKLSKKTSKPLPQATKQQKQQFQSQIRKNRIIYYDKQIQRLQKRDKYLKSIAIETLQSLIYTTIISQQQQKNLQFTFSEWKNLQKVFVQYQSVVTDDKRKKDIPEIQKKEKFLVATENQTFVQYVRALKYLEEKNNMKVQQQQLATFVDRLIEKAYPKNQNKININLPLYMPLRIGLTGSQLSGKTTLIKKLLTKYNNLVLIDPKKIITEALQLARPPPADIDPKKKKDPKKVQQQTPERIQLKKFGQQLLSEIKSQLGSQTQLSAQLQYQNLDFKYTLKAIKYKLLQNFSQTSPQKLLQKYNKHHQAQKQRINDFQKNQQQKNKKKDSKKGQPTEIVVQSPIFNQFFFTEGFIIENLNLSDQKLRQIQRDLNGFVKVQQTLNQIAQKLRQQFSLILPIKKTQIPQVLNKGFFNVLIDLDVSSELQQQRNQGRKIDPTTGQVYHPKFAPIPTDVKGLAQKLVDVKKYQLQPAQLKYQNKFKRQVYYKSFGYQNKKQSSYHSISQLPLEQVNGEVVKIIENILKIEYQKIKSYTPVVNENNQGEKKGQQNNETLIQNEQILQSNNQQSQYTNIYGIIQPVQKNTQTDLVGKLNNKIAQTLLSKLQSYNFSYQRSLIQLFQILHTQIRHRFQQQFMIQQRSFVQIIARPDDKANRILTFQDNFNKLLEQKASVINDKQAIKHLVDKLDELYDSLWINIQVKKNEAINRRKYILANNWLNSQVQQIVQIGKQVLQSELNYMVDILAFLLMTQIQLEGNNNQPVIDYLCLGIPKQNQPIQSIAPSISNNKTSPRLQYYFSQVQQCLSSISQWFYKKQLQSKVKLSPALQSISVALIQKQTIRINIVISHLKEQLFSCIQEEVCYYKALINKMDDWIIFGIKEENDFTYKIYKQLKASILRLSKSQLKDLFPTSLTAYVRPIQRLSKFHQPFPSVNSHQQIFNYSSFKIFLQEIRSFSYTSNNNSDNSSQSIKISFSRFKQYFTKRIKSKLLSQIYLRLDFDIMQQFLVLQNQANFKQIALSMLYWNFKVLDQQAIANYHSKLSSNKQKQFILHPQELSIVQILDDVVLSDKEIKCLQYFVFDIMKSQYTNQVLISVQQFAAFQIWRWADDAQLAEIQVRWLSKQKKIRKIAKFNN